MARELVAPGDGEFLTCSCEAGQFSSNTKSSTRLPASSAPPHVLDLDPRQILVDLSHLCREDEAAEHLPHPKRPVLESHTPEPREGQSLPQVFYCHVLPSVALTSKGEDSVGPDEDLTARNLRSEGRPTRTRYLASLSCSHRTHGGGKVDAEEGNGRIRDWVDEAVDLREVQ
eukprot:747383-Hanusia_phi.AAC.4